MRRVYVYPPCVHTAESAPEAAIRCGTLPAPGALPCRDRVFHRDANGGVALLQGPGQCPLVPGLLAPNQRRGRRAGNDGEDDYLLSSGSQVQYDRH
jgi:hypothetical protein